MFWQFRNIPKNTSESFIKKVAGYWLIKKRLQRSCFHADCVKCSKNTFFEEPLKIAVNNNSNLFLKINHLLRKITAGAFVSFRAAIPANLIYRRPLFSNLLWPNHKFFYIYAPQQQTLIHVKIAQLDLWRDEVVRNPFH